MTTIHPWVLGLGPKPDHLFEMPTAVVHDKVYPKHRYALEIDPLEHQCESCGCVTDLRCERCDALTCEDCYGHEKFSPDSGGPSGHNYCESCMDSYNHCGQYEYD